MDCESLPRDPIMRRLLCSEGELRRDLDYLRQMLAEMEASPDWQHLIGFDDGEDDPDADKRLYHAKLMQDEGLLEPMQPGIYRMTAKGHDFLDHTNDPDIWTRSKEVAGKLRDHSLTMLSQVAEGYVRAKIREFTGLDI